MRFPRHSIPLVVVLLAMPSRYAQAHWCDDLWSSGYDIVVRPDSDTSPTELYVENRWGYQLIDFELIATSASGQTIALTPPTTLTQANTLLPGEKGIWKIASGNPAKIEDITFDVRFGDTSGATPKQWACYPVLGANPVMVVKNDGTLFPTTISGLDSPKSNSARGCSLGDVGLGSSLQDQTIADWEDEGAGLDKLLPIYYSGRGSWGIAGPVGNYAGEGVARLFQGHLQHALPNHETDRVPGLQVGLYAPLGGRRSRHSEEEYYGARLAVARQRLLCGANDRDSGMPGTRSSCSGTWGRRPDRRVRPADPGTRGRRPRHHRPSRALFDGRHDAEGRRTSGYPVELGVGQGRLRRGRRHRGQGRRLGQVGPHPAGPVDRAGRPRRCHR